MEPVSKLAVIWTSFGPYHRARIKALEKDFKVHAIQLAAGEQRYRWSASPSIGLLPSTLFTCNWEEVRPFRMIIRLWRALSRSNPDLLLVPGYSTLMALTGAVWAKVHGKRTILMSESTEIDKRRVLGQEKLKRLIVTTLFDTAVVGGQPHRRYVEKLGICPDRTALYYDVVDNDHYTRQTSAARCNGNLRDNLSEQYFLYVGRMAVEKNIPILLKAFSSYRANGGSWHLVLAGDGPVRQEVEQLRAALGLVEFVVLVGHCNTEDLIPLYANAAAFILPSLSEPWGLVVNEAMASSLPVLVSDRCGCADSLVEHGSNGFLFDARSSDALSSYMQTIADMSSQELASMGARSLSRIQEYSLDNWARSIQYLADLPPRRT